MDAIANILLELEQNINYDFLHPYTSKSNFAYIRIYHADGTYNDIKLEEVK